MNDNKGSCCTPSRQASGTSSLQTEQIVAGAIKSSGMVNLPGGRFLMGTDYARGFSNDGEGPVRPVDLSPFLIDITPVTNAQFRAFVEATGYRTEAEHYQWSFVFWSHLPEIAFANLVEDTLPGAPWWCKVRGAKWSTPEGPGSDVLARSNHPVVHVSHNDASAYAAWTGKQLPTEAEWEYAARGDLEQALYPWGNELTPAGKHLCNVWQGEFPIADTGEDGFSGTCPVTAFPPNGFGLYGMTGNVWEWTADWFGINHVNRETFNPLGPAEGPGKVVKGGSFLCHASYCNRYRVAARTQNTPDSSTSNMGFRCVRRR